MKFEVMVRLYEPREVEAERVSYGPNWVTFYRDDTDMRLDRPCAAFCASEVLWVREVETDAVDAEPAGVS